MWVGVDAVELELFQLLNYRQDFSVCVLKGCEVYQLSTRFFESVVAKAFVA